MPPNLLELAQSIDILYPSVTHFKEKFTSYASEITGYASKVRQSMLEHSLRFYLSLEHTQH